MVSIEVVCQVFIVKAIAMLIVALASPLFAMMHSKLKAVCSIFTSTSTLPLRGFKGAEALYPNLCRACVMAPVY